MQEKWQDFEIETLYVGGSDGYELSIQKNGELLIFDTVPTEDITLIEQYEDSDWSLLALAGTRHLRLYDLRKNDRITNGWEDWVETPYNSLSFERRDDGLHFVAQAVGYMRDLQL